MDKPDWEFLQITQTDGLYFVKDHDGNMLKPSKKNAHFVVMACNLHNDLLLSCKELLEYVRTHRPRHKLTLAEINASKVIAKLK
jgi:hypothetical protein